MAVAPPSDVRVLFIKNAVFTEMTRSTSAKAHAGTVLMNRFNKFKVKGLVFTCKYREIDRRKQDRTICDIRGHTAPPHPQPSRPDDI